MRWYRGDPCIGRREFDVQHDPGGDDRAQIPCTEDDTASPFILHWASAAPRAWLGLTADNRDVSCVQRGVRVENACLEAPPPLDGGGERRSVRAGKPVSGCCLRPARGRTLPRTGHRQPLRDGGRGRQGFLHVVPVCAHPAPPARPRAGFANPAFECAWQSAVDSACLWACSVPAPSSGEPRCLWPGSALRREGLATGCSAIPKP